MNTNLKEFVWKRWRKKPNIERKIQAIAGDLENEY
jgi:hypothetical protein